MAERGPEQALAAARRVVALVGEELAAFRRRALLAERTARDAEQRAAELERTVEAARAEAAEARAVAAAHDAAARAARAALASETRSGTPPAAGASAASLVSPEAQTVGEAGAGAEPEPQLEPLVLYDPSVEGADEALPALAAENAELRRRLASASRRVRGLLERLRFLRDQERRAP